MSEGDPINVAYWHVQSFKWPRVLESPVFVRDMTSTNWPDVYSFIFYETERGNVVAIRLVKPWEND